MPENFDITAMAIVLGGWIFSVCFHEFSHALIAYIGGDTSVKDKGYLTFNPLRYTHPTFSIVYPIIFLLIGGIGLPGAAVYVNRDALRNRLWDSAVSLAGPLSNALLFCALMVPFWYGMADPKGQPVFWAAYAFLCYLQMTAVIFNLLPVPPLDGFGAISAFMYWRIRNYLYAHSQMFFFILIIAMYNVKPVGKAYWQFMYRISNEVNMPLDLVFKGLSMVRLNLWGQ